MATLNFERTGATDETSTNFSWNCDEYVMKVTCYYKPTPGSQNYVVVYNGSRTKNGTFTLENLIAGTKYDIYLTAELYSTHTIIRSISKMFETYQYPYITSISSSTYVIGNSQTVRFYNPLLHNVTVYMKKDNTSGTRLNYGDYITADTKCDLSLDDITLYNSIPNSTSGTAVYYVEYGGHIVKTITGTYRIKGDETPDFYCYNFSEDLVTTNFNSLTNDTNTLIKNYSTFTYNLTDTAYPYYGATINKYIMTWGSKSATRNNIGTFTLSAGENNTLTIAAFDSRGLSTKRTEYAYFVEYFNPTIDNNIKTNRDNGIETGVKLNLSGTFFNSRFGSDGVQNELYSAKYYVSTDNSTWSTGYTIPLSNFTISGNTFELEDFVIHADGTSGGFPIGTKYYVKVEIKDAQGLLGTATKTSIVTDGKIARAVYKDYNGEYHIGINGLADDDYTETINGTLNMKGDITLQNAHFLKGYDNNNNEIRLIRAWNNTTAVGDGDKQTIIWSDSVPKIKIGSSGTEEYNIVGIYKKTVTGTTDGNGFIQTGLSNDYVIIGATANFSSNLYGFVLPYYQNANSIWTINCKNWNMQPLASTNITITIYYIKVF